MRAVLLLLLLLLLLLDVLQVDAAQRMAVVQLIKSAAIVQR
jgi:hypothetical protein